MPTIQDSKNLLVNRLNKNQSGNVQTNINKSGPTNTKDISVNNILPNQNLKAWTQNKLQQKGIIQPNIQTNNNSKIQAQMDKWKQLNNQQNVNFVANQNNNKSMFIGLQNNNNNLPSTDLGGNIIQSNVDKKKKEEFDRRANKPVLNIPTKKSQIEQFNKNQSETYRTNENVIKDFHYDVQKFGGQMSREQISQLYPEFAGKEDIALMLQSDLLPLVQNNEFADMKKLSELYPELLPKQKKAGDQILKDQEKEGQQIKDLAKKAEKTLSRYNVLSKNGEKYMQDVWQVGNFVDTIRKDYKLPGNPSDLDIINFGKENIPELKAILDDMEMLKSNYNLTERDRDIIFENGFDLGEWLYQAGADIQNFTQNNQLGDYLDRNSSTWERQLSNLGINGSSANTIANLPKKALDTAEIPVNMLGSLSSGVGKLGMATERIATQQNRNEDGTTDYNGIAKDVIRGGGGALEIGFNTVMAIPTAIFHLANETEAGKSATDQVFGTIQDKLDKLQSGEATNSNNAFNQWYNGLDDETKADLLNEEMVALFSAIHKGGGKVGGKVKKLGEFEINSAKNAINEALQERFNIESSSATFKAKVEKGLADGTMKVSDDGMLTDAQGNNIGKVKVTKEKLSGTDKVKYVVNKVIADNRIAWNKGELNADVNMNALPDNRTFREKTESKINQAKETAYEGAYQMGKMTRNAVDTVKEGVQDINVGNAVKGTAEAVGKGVKATSDLLSSGKNAVTKGYKGVKNAVNENVVEPFKKGYEGVKETVNENIVDPYNKGRGKTTVNKGTDLQGQQQPKSNSTSEINNKVNGDNFKEKTEKSKTLNKAQLKILQNNNRMNPKSIDTFKERYGEDYGQHLYDRGFTKTADGGNLKDMEDYKDSLLALKRETMNKIEGTYQDIALSDMAEHLVEKATNVKNRKLLKEATELLNKHNSEGLETPEIDRLRTLFQQNVKMGFHADIPADARERATNEYMAVKELLDDIGRKNGFTDLDTINREIQKIQHIIKGVESKLNRESANNAYTLTDYIIMAEAFSNPETASVFIAKQILKNPKVRNAGLNAVVGGRGNAKNRVTAESRAETNKNVESIASAKRKQKEMGLSESPALPESIRLRNVTEIDRRKPKTEESAPVETEEKVEKKGEKKPKKKSEKKNVVSEKSKITEKKETPKEEKPTPAKTEEKVETKQEVKKDHSENNLAMQKTEEKLPKDMTAEERKAYNEKIKKQMQERADSKAKDILGDKDKSPDKKAKELAREYRRYSEDVKSEVDKWYKDNGYEVHDYTGREFSRDEHDMAEGDGMYDYSDIISVEDGGDTCRMESPLIMKDGEVISRGKFYIEKADDVSKRSYRQPKNTVTAQKSAVTQPKAENKPEPKQEPKQEDKSGGNAFGLKEQKGSSRINNFTNVVKKIIDKYEDKIESHKDGPIYDIIRIDEKPREPLEIRLNGNKDQLMIRHIGPGGYDDPAMLFNIEDGKLHVIGVKLAFMEQMGNDLWSRDIKDTDELLHTRAVNLEDQFLGERNIDEDTGVMKEGKSESAPKEVKDRTSNANIINNIKSFDDLKDLLKPTKAGAVSDWEYEGELNGVKTRVWNYGDTIFVKYGDGQGPAQARIDIKDADHIDQLKELLSEINNDGEILESNRNNPYNKATTEVTGEKSEVTSKTVEEKPKNLVTNRPVDNSSITGKFRDLTLQDYKTMQKYEGLEDIYLNENIDTLKRALAIQDTLDALKTSEEANDGSYEWNNSNFDIQEHKIDLHDKEVRKAIDEFIELYELSERVENGKATKEDQNKYDYFIDDYDEKTGKPDWNDEYIIEESQDRIQNIFKGDVYNPFISDFYNEFGRQIAKDTHKDLAKDINELKGLVDKYGEYWNQGKSVAKSENTNIIGKNNSLTTKNPINDKGGEKGNGDSEGQKQLSNSEGVLGESEGGRQGVSDKNSTSGGEKTLMSSGDNNKESGSGLTNGGTHKSIRTKGDNVITAKTVTQARDTNRECVNILEKHKYSTNPADYTAEEIETLRQYEGRGGVNDKEDMNTQGALNQYYTKDNIIKAMWRLLDGYNNTDILEPSMGVGRFFMYAPEGSNLAGFEYDKIPGTIAKILYPNADIKIGDFQDNFMLGGKRSVGEYYNGKKYDIVIGNPPYEERQGRQMGLGEEPKISRFDDYFIKRGVDMLKPGGHLAFVTSSQFLRGADNYAKQMISQKADLIDAYRIPIGAFDRTGVETDIIVLERKEGGGDSSLLSASKWFDKHPDKVLGEERNDIKGRFGLKTGVVGDLAEIDNIAQAHLGSDGKPANLEVKFTPNKTEPKVDTEKPKNVVTATKKTAITQKSQPKVKAPKQEIKEGEWTDWTMDKKDDNGNITKVPIGKSYMGVLFKGIPGQETGKLVVGKGGIGKYQNVLNSNGKIGDPSITLESDREGLNYINGELEPNILYATGNIPNKLAQLEADYNANRIDEQQYNKQKDLLEQALPEPIDFQDIDRNPYSDWVLDTETESLATVWKNSEEGYVDKKQTIRELFKTYISGKDKELGTVSVKKVKKNGDIDFEHQSLATAMIKVLEKQGRGFAKEMEDELTVRMPEEFSKFMKSEIDDTTKQRLQDEFNRKFNNYKNFDYSELGYTIDDVSAKGHWTPSDVQSRGVARILTTESLIVAYGVGQGKTFTGAEGAIASMQQGKATKCLIVVPIGTKSDWMRTIAENNPNQEIVDLGTLAPGSGARERLSAAFGHDPRNWIKPGQIGILVDSALGKQISFKPDTLQFLQEKLTDVTNTPFSRETEVDKLKKQKEELEAENNDYYISNAQLEKNKKKLEKITGELESIESNKVDYGMIVRRYSGKALPDEGISTALDHVYEDYDEYLDNMNKYLDEHEDIDREKALKILNKIYDNERPIYLEELGIDHLTVDEAHNYRNLFNKSVDDDEEGGGGWRASVDISKGSAAAMNLYGMSQYIMEKNNGGNVILLTATPFINEPSEVYNMLSYVGKNGMEEMGIENMDDFFDTYVGLTNKLLIKPSGTDVTNKNVMLQFNNTRALINSLLDRYIDYEGESDLIVKPRQNTYPVRLKMGSRQEEIQKKLEVQIDENNFDDVWQGEPIYVTTKDGDTVTLASTRKVDDKGKTKGAVIEGMGQANSDLISPYLTKYNKDKLSEVTPKELIDTSPKLKAVVEIIKATRQSGINRGVFVYMPIGTELHELLQKAIELENPGIKVGIINGESKYADMTKTQAEKLGLGDPKGARARETGKKFSDGEIDVLIGGENTKEGLNLQGNGYITIEVSQPRNPNDRTQLHGRVWRKGNKSNEVLVIPLLMENSSDIYRFQRMQHKNSRWSLLESLAAYKRGEDIDNLKPQEDMNLEEQKLALFTEPERKAKVSITMDKAELSNQLQKLDGSIQGLEGVLKTMESWGSTRGQYKDYAHNDPYKVLKDGTGKDITTNILDENALEPLQQKLDYYHDKAAKSYAEQHPEWNKAQIENAIKKESPYNSDASNYNYTKRFEMAQARGERNAVVRQMNAIGLKSIDELKSYLENLHNEKELLERKIRNIENTKQERIEKYRREIEENKANALDLEDIIEDLKEEFKHQITFKTEGELRDWLKVTENLPKRNVAKSKSDIQHGLNKYSWKSEDYVGIKPKNTEIRKNKVTSQFAQYTDENKKPEFEFNRFVPKQRITKEDGTWLTKIGYQNKLRKGLKDVLRKEKSASIKAEHSGKTMEEELKGDKFYETWISRIMGNITRLAEENAFEIIQAYESDHPELIGDTTPENFLDYVNDYKIENGKEDKIPDKFAIEGAEILSDKYQEYLDTGEIKEGTKNKVTGNGKNKITNG